MRIADAAALEARIVDRLSESSARADEQRNAIMGELSALEVRIVDRINGRYVRAGECKLREDHVIEKLGQLSSEIAHIKEDL